MSPGLPWAPGFAQVCVSPRHTSPDVALSSPILQVFGTGRSRKVTALTYRLPTQTTATCLAVSKGGPREMDNSMYNKYCVLI